MISLKERTLHPRRLHGTQIRAKVEAGIREFFLKQGFIETRTPLLVPCPGMETHIRPFRVQSTIPEPSQTDPAPLLFLPTSPEFAMKRLLVGGLERIFQICPAFRDEPHSPCHRPEFTLLEWYRAHVGYEAIQEDTEALVEFLAIRLFGKPEFQFQGKTLSVRRPWPRLKIRDLFLQEVGIDLVQVAELSELKKRCQSLNLPVKLPVNDEDTWDDLFFKIWLNLIEPRLPSNQAVFVTRFPPSQAALAVTDPDPDGSIWAKRFEFYIAGMELGNAFEELTDPLEQRLRFERDMDLREKIYGPSFPRNPMDEGFLKALEEGMPPAGGIAVGVDRLVMLFADEPEIQFTFWSD